MNKNTLKLKFGKETKGKYFILNENENSVTKNDEGWCAAAQSKEKLP